MANREKGEETVVIDGKPYTLRIDLHAWALAQDALCKGATVPSMDVIAARLSANHMLTILVVFWASLQRYHAKDAADVRQATVLFEKSGGAAADALVKAVSRSGADEADTKELGVGANPPQAQGDKPARGVGDKSTSGRAASA